MNIRYRVTLSAEERARLLDMVQGGKGAVRRLKRAQTPLVPNPPITDNVFYGSLSFTQPWPATVSEPNLAIYCFPNGPLSVVSAVMTAQPLDFLRGTD